MQTSSETERTRRCGLICRQCSSCKEAMETTPGGRTDKEYRCLVDGYRIDPFMDIGDPIPVNCQLSMEQILFHAYWKSETAKSLCDWYNHQKWKIWISQNVSDKKQ